MDEQYSRDCILPLIEMSLHEDGFDYESFHGTCFLIGSDGYAITNLHLLGVRKGNELGVLIVENGLWRAHIVEATETHPVEDIAILKLRGMKYKSFLKISTRSEYSPCKYKQLSYPEDVESELVIDNRVVHRPDLIYLEGYIRRRMSNMEIPLKGSDFYELSEPGSTGCSGSPVIDMRGGEIWDVIGVYCGNKTSALNGNISGVRHAVRSDAICDWKPSILNKKISDEFRKVVTRS